MGDEPRGDGWRHIDIWFQGGTDEEARELVDAVADAAFGVQPEGIDLHIDGTLNGDEPPWIAPLSPQEDKAP